MEWLTFAASAIAALAVIGIPYAIRSFKLQRRAEARDLEPRDVVWSASRYDDNSGWYFEHSGTITALRVKVDLTIDGRTSTKNFDLVEPNQHVEVEHTWHKDLVEESKARERRYEREREASSWEVEIPFGIGSSIKVPAFISNPIPIPPVAYRAEAVFVVNWVSPLGRQDRQERNWTEIY